MATLTNNINDQNVVDRFADYVVATANASIIYADNANPFAPTYSSYFPNIWGGSTTGKTIGITGTNLGGTGSLITAATIVSVLRAETTAYTRIRNLRAVLTISGAGNTVGAGTRVDAGPITGQGPGNIIDVTGKANLSTTYLQTLGATASTGIATDSDINTLNLETFFTNLRTAYTTARDTVQLQQVTVCHASCHSNCHSSRGRR